MASCPPPPGHRRRGSPLRLLPALLRSSCLVDLTPTVFGAPAPQGHKAGEDGGDSGGSRGIGAGGEPAVVTLCCYPENRVKDLRMCSPTQHPTRAQSCSPTSLTLEAPLHPPAAGDPTAVTGPCCRGQQAAGPHAARSRPAAGTPVSSCALEPRAAGGGSAGLQV